jgi:hypothetical protein
MQEAGDLTKARLLHLEGPAARYQEWHAFSWAAEICAYQLVRTGQCSELRGALQ